MIFSLFFYKGIITTEIIDKFIELLKNNGEIKDISYIIDYKNENSYFKIIHNIKNINDITYAYRQISKNLIFNIKNGKVKYMNNNDNHCIVIELTKNVTNKEIILLEKEILKNHPKINNIQIIPYHKEMNKLKIYYNGEKPNLDKMMILKKIEYY
jgi:hypothetical protein